MNRFVLGQWKKIKELHRVFQERKEKKEENTTTSVAFKDEDLHSMSFCCLCFYASMKKLRP